MPAEDSAAAAGQGATDKLIRHEWPDRVFHWLMAVSMLVLLGTGLLPILGIKFPWVTAHWIAGLVLTVAALFHTVRAVFWQDLCSMWIPVRDLQNLWRLVVTVIRRTDDPLEKPGKYSLAQKAYHHAITLVVLVAIVTGVVMMIGIDTPFWERNSTWLSEATRGVIYVLHGFATLFSVTLIMLHVYFAFRPEKLHFTRSMLLGWITRDEYVANHDPLKWGRTSITD